MAATVNPVAERMTDLVDNAVVVEDLKKHFPVRGSHGGGEVIKAVDGVSFALHRGEALGLAGESGCGKTTTGRLLLRLLEPTGGRIEFDGADVAKLSGKAMHQFRRRAQLMFQNPYEAVNPRFTILRTILEPLLIHRIGDEQERFERAYQALEAVNLNPNEYADKYPHQLSGGQLQRVVLARALVLEPKLLIADEPVSMLDVSVRAGVLNLMRKISEQLELATMYISHDLSLIRYMCERTAVMYLGRIVEIGPTDELIENPRHPYTQALIKAVPLPDPDVKEHDIGIKDSIPSPINLPAGCRFSDRCPQATSRCRTDEPQKVMVGENHYTSCILYQ